LIKSICSKITIWNLSNGRAKGNIKEVEQMIEFKGRAVAITGAASGFGREMAKRCHALGAKLALADIDTAGLATLEAELKEMNADFFTAKVDVSKFEEMQAFADKTFSLYPDLALFFNNAGVRYLCFCSGVPRRFRAPPAKELWAPIAMFKVGDPLDSSSVMSSLVTQSPPSPPNSSGYTTPIKPSSPARLKRWRGYSSFISISRLTGRTSFSTNSLATLRINSRSSVINHILYYLLLI
jgi:NAD(P)-dependent dehydrogenase (short-subunit alcohol dehydrogenase family)